MRVWHGVLCVSLLFAADALAQPSDLGEPFRVNGYTSSDQAIPTVARLADGGFVVVWLRSGLDGPVVATRFDAAAMPASAELQVSDGEAKRRTRLDVAGTADGGFVVVWRESAVGGQDPPSVWLRAFDASAAPKNDPIMVGADGQLRDAGAVAVTAAGGMLVWQGSGTGDDDGVFGHRLDALGTLVGTEFRINETTTGDQTSPTVAGNEGGQFIVGWVSDPSPFHEGPGIVAQRLDVNGALQGTELRVSDPGTDYSGNPAAMRNPKGAVNEAGQFVVAWTMQGPSDGYYYPNHGVTVDNETRVRRFGASGDTLGDHSRFGDALLGVGVDESGTFVVAHVARFYPYENSDFAVDYPDELLLSSITPAGDAATSVIAQSSQYLFDEYSTIGAGDIAADASGHFIVVWSDIGYDTGNEDIFARASPVGDQGPPCGEASTHTSDGTQVHGAVGLGEEPARGDARAGTIVSTDALAILFASVGLRACEACVCDVDGSGAVQASDALLALRKATGQPVLLRCPACA